MEALALTGARVLVTGATGVVGGVLVTLLREAGADVVTLSRSTGGDVTDPAAVAHACAGCTTVFHLAGLPLAGDDPVRLLDVNVMGTVNVLAAAADAGVAQVVVAGSGASYGRPGPRPVGEDHPLAARELYAVSKSCADIAARAAIGPPAAVVRLGNVIGLGDPHASRLVPGALAALRAGRAPVVHNDGTSVREFLHAEDAARAFLVVADALAQDPGSHAGTAWNAGAGAHRVGEVVELLCEITGSEVSPKFGKAPTDELRLDCARLRGLGWSPRHGLRATLAWAASG